MKNFYMGVNYFEENRVNREVSALSFKQTGKNKYHQLIL